MPATQTSDLGATECRWQYAAVEHTHAAVNPQVLYGRHDLCKDQSTLRNQCVIGH